MLLFEDPPLPRQQFAICFVQSEVELSLDRLLLNCRVGSELRSSIHKNFEARVLKVLRKTSQHKDRRVFHKTGCFNTARIHPGISSRPRNSEIFLFYKLVKHFAWNSHKRIRNYFTTKVAFTL